MDCEASVDSLYDHPLHSLDQRTTALSAHQCIVVLVKHALANCPAAHVMRFETSWARCKAPTIPFFWIWATFIAASRNSTIGHFAGDTAINITAFPLKSGLKLLGSAGFKQCPLPGLKAKLFATPSVVCRADPGANFVSALRGLPTDIPLS